MKKSIILNNKISRVIERNYETITRKPDLEYHIFDEYKTNEYIDEYRDEYINRYKEM